MDRDFWDTIYLDGDYDKDDNYGKWYENPKYVNEPPHIFVRQDSLPTPSTDFTTPLSDPNGNYLLWDEENLSWYVGTCLYGEEGFVVFTWQGAVPCFTITHWLPLPNNPLTNSENE